jgi:hypothetical protein
MKNKPLKNLVLIDLYCVEDGEFMGRRPFLLKFEAQQS